MNPSSLWAWLLVVPHAGVVLLASALVAAGQPRSPARQAGLQAAAAGLLASVTVSSLAATGIAASAWVLLAAAAWAFASVLAARCFSLGQVPAAVAAFVLAVFAGMQVAQPGGLAAWVSGGFFANAVPAAAWLLASICVLVVVLMGLPQAMSPASRPSGLSWVGRLQRQGFVVRMASALLLALLLIGPALPGSVAVTATGLAPWLWSAGGLVASLLLATVMLLAQAGDTSGAATRPSSRLPARELAALDSLTQLPTRVFFESRLAAVARSSEAKGHRMALFFIDLDGFKPINDSFGHQTGDLVLEQVGQRLRRLVGRKGLAARVGGDEFLLLLTQAGDEKVVALAAQRIIKVLSQPYSVQERSIVISCSVGIALYPGDCEPAALITRADAAMYAAKRAGGSRHCFYTPDLDEAARTNFDLLADLRRAAENNEFELQYQPKIDARTGQVTGAEALLRWRHPQRGLVMPGDFIQVAERFGLISTIGDWVINDACRQVREWREKGLRMRVAINLSVHQMRQEDIADRIAQALHEYNVHPSLLTCEITETVAMEDTRATQETFRRLGELGAHLSIDDFGTGYSSLAYLRKLPAAELKIDRLMVTDIEHSSDACAVVDAVVQLAHALGLKVVAEGVENQRQQQILVNLGCDELQGFLFARPMSSRALLLWALGGRSDAPSFKPSLFGETRAATPEQKARTRALTQPARSPG